MYNIVFKTSEIFTEYVGYRCYKGIVNSASNLDSVVIGKHIAILIESDGDGNSRKLVEQEFDSSGHAIEFLYELLTSVKDTP